MIKSTIYFIQEHLHLKVAHGGTGNADADKILLRLGYSPVEFPERENFSIAAKFKRMLYLLIQLRRIRKIDVLIFQFPLYAGMSKLLVQLLLRNKTRLVCFITDIDGLKDGDDIKLKREKKYLQQFSLFVVHNSAMKKWLLQIVPHARVSTIDFFDFLAEPSLVKRKPAMEMVFAGNLSKSLFLEHLDELKLPVRWNVYGPGVTPRMQAQHSVNYKGVVDAYALPSMVEGSFGLVWDGDSMNGSGGIFGNYMQFITHHKLSLYILAGLPVICYSGAGSAELIRTYGIGLLIDDLQRLSTLLGQVTEDQYARMQENMRVLAHRISNGQCLADAIKTILEKTALDKPL